MLTRPEAQQQLSSSDSVTQAVDLHFPIFMNAALGILETQAA